MMAAFALIAVLAGGSGSAIAFDPLELGAPEVRAVASPSEVRLGQPITLIVTATYSANVVVNLPDPLFPAGAPMETTSRDSTDSMRADGHLIREWQIKAYAWELGEFDIPPIDVTFTAGGRAATVPTNSIPIRVIGVLGDVDDKKLMRANSKPVDLLSRSWLLAWLAGGGATLIGMMIYFWFFYRPRKRKPKAKQPALVRLAESPLASSAPQETADDKGDGDPVREVPAPPPPVAPPKQAVIVRARRKLDRIAEEALARLRAIELSGRLDTDRRGAYRDMVTVIRDYLGARYDIDAPELTTRELCQALTFRSAEAAGLTRAWLADCDLVKYAARSATGDEARGILDGACWLVDRTSPGATRAESAHA